MSSRSTGNVREMTGGEEAPAEDESSALAGMHPRPQFARPGWVDLTGPWGFAHDDVDCGLDAGWYDQPQPFDRTIIVPFPPESRASGIADTGFHPVVWYRRAVRLAAGQRAGRVILHFGAVDYRATVWVNGHLVARHEGGQTPFHADITTALLPGDSEQVVTVRAEDDPFDLTQPRGKQDWKRDCHAIWYKRTTGIWQPVWLETVPPIHLTELLWTPDTVAVRFGLRVRLNRTPDRPLRVRVHLSQDGIVIADDTWIASKSETERLIGLDRGSAVMERTTFFWTPEHPNLFEAEVTLLDGDEVIDTVFSYAGLRSVGVADRWFQLNDRPYYLRMALEQGYWPESHLAAPDEAAMCREIELTKALGFNGIRIHQKVEDPRFLALCDRLGLIVWGEMASAYVYSDEGFARYTREWIDVVRRDASHPCIVAWVPYNESWGVPNVGINATEQAAVQALYHTVRALDPTRPVIANDGWETPVGNIFGVHDYTFDAAVLAQRYGTSEAVAHTLAHIQPSARRILLLDIARGDTPVMVTEFGGISYAPATDEKWYGYGTARTPDEYLDRFSSLVGALLASPAIAGFCYTQLTDTEQETNGLLTEDRLPKFHPETIRAILNSPPVAIPAAVLAAHREKTRADTGVGDGVAIPGETPSA
ncbi:MAG: GH2 [uncultured Thermomicrobiales bacterium]|uniref:GH2 n=1 Tax=uncultured Thermomicrobiales bacterium TaxID=1645740 RepID=A0A6J4UC59_9BACT|nr:MAG: GH2 [uncultured Thermomicrobiales bacterium]